MADKPIYDNLQAPKETINAINDTNTLSATQSTSVYQCPKCGRLMKSDLAMCGICLFYQMNAEINGWFNVY